MPTETPTTPLPPTSAPATSSTVHLAVYDTLADWQPGTVIAHLVGHPWRQRTPGRFALRTVGPTRDPVVTTGGVRILPDLGLDELDPADSAMLILPGADAWVPLHDLRAAREPGGDEPDLLAAFARAARTFVDAGVPVAAIGGATAGLARVGLLDDRAHTSEMVAFVERSGYAGAAHYREALAVTDGDVVTASGTAPVEFAREIFTRLALFDPPVLDAWYRLYGEQEGSALHDLMAASRPA
jgi:putative intracellular protease/amidase